MKDVVIKRDFIKTKITSLLLYKIIINLIKIRSTKKLRAVYGYIKGLT